MILETISLVLEIEQDFEVMTLNDPSKWRSAVEQFKPDILLVDYRMPAMRGDHLIQSLNSAGLRSSIQVVGLFSASKFSPDDVQKIGADLLIEKPFNIDELLFRLREEMQCHQKQRVA